VVPQQVCEELFHNERRLCSQDLGYPSSPICPGYPSSPLCPGYPISPMCLGYPSSPMCPGVDILVLPPMFPGYPSSPMWPGYPSSPCVSRAHDLKTQARAVTP